MRITGASEETDLFTTNSQSIFKRKRVRNNIFPHTWKPLGLCLLSKAINVFIKLYLSCGPCASEVLSACTRFHFGPPLGKLCSSAVNICSKVNLGKQELKSEIWFHCMFVCTRVCLNNVCVYIGKFAGELGIFTSLLHMGRYNDCNYLGDI